MSEQCEIFQDLKAIRSKKAASNREWSANYLRDLGFKFDIKNNGAHLIVWTPLNLSRDLAPTINFWPGTGLFMAPGLRGRGVKKLVAVLQGRKPWKIYGD